MYLTKTIKIKAESFGSVELNSEKSKGFKPLNLQIKVNSENDDNHSSYAEICNILVMGENQLASESGVMILDNRGNTFFFNKIRDVDFNYIYPSQGQGLIIELYNPHIYDIEVQILLSGESCPYDKNKSGIKYLFKYFEIDSKSIKKLPLKINSYDKLFSVENLQIISYDDSETDIHPIIKNIIINGESQFENIEDVNISTKFFDDMTPFKMRELPRHSKGTYITLENKENGKIKVYIALVGKLLQN